MTPERMQELVDLTAGIQGWLYRESGMRLYDLAFRAPLPVAIELGSWRGLSTAWTALGLKDRGGPATLYAVDHWQGSADEPIHAQIRESLGPDGLYEEFLANMRHCGVSEIVKPIRSNTLSAAAGFTESVGLLFIDAGHSEEAVFADYRAWSPRVAPGGFIVFDDVPGWPGPSRVARGVAAKELIFVEESHNNWVGQKR